jgi:hypothetical protein
MIDIKAMKNSNALITQIKNKELKSSKLPKMQSSITFQNSRC